MKPEFTKPFNIEHAKAGAPYCCCDGGEATVLKWDCNHHSYPLIGAICQNGSHYPESWTASGIQASDEEVERRPWRDLVMLPLGMIDGKPVFVGDEIEDAHGQKRVAHPVMTTFPQDHGFRWPAPAKVYPEFDGSMDALAIAHMEHQKGDETNSFARSLRAAANAALRHAIDAGQVVNAANRAARDLAIAEVVRDAAYVKVMNCQSGHEGTVVRQLDLAAIIANVK